MVEAIDRKNQRGPYKILDQYLYRRTLSNIRDKRTLELVVADPKMQFTYGKADAMTWLSKLCETQDPNFPRLETASTCSQILEAEARNIGIDCAQHLQQAVATKRQKFRRVIPQDIWDIYHLR